MLPRISPSSQFLVASSDPHDSRASHSQMTPWTCTALKFFVHKLLLSRNQGLESRPNPLFHTHTHTHTSGPHRTSASDYSPHLTIVSDHSCGHVDVSISRTNAAGSESAVGYFCHPDIIESQLVLEVFKPLHLFILTRLDFLHFIVQHPTHS